MVNQNKYIFDQKKRIPLKYAYSCHSWPEVGVRPVLNSHEIFLLILKPMPKPSSKVLKTKSFNEGF